MERHEQGKAVPFIKTRWQMDQATAFHPAAGLGEIDEAVAPRLERIWDAISTDLLSRDNFRNHLELLAPDIRDWSVSRVVIQLYLSLLADKSPEEIVWDFILTLTDNQYRHPWKKYPVAKRAQMRRDWVGLVEQALSDPGPQASAP